MKKIFFTCLSALLINLVNGQSAQSVYFELGGPGLASVNFDTRLTGREDGIGVRGGIGGFSVDGETALFFPLQLNYILGKDNRNYFEFGGGATIVSLNGNDSFQDDDDAFTGTFGHLYFGYRLQPANGGFLFRAGITPVFGNGYFIPYYAGISFGYKFSRNR